MNCNYNDKIFFKLTIKYIKTVLKSNQPYH